MPAVLTATLTETLNERAARMAGGGSKHLPEPEGYEYVGSEMVVNTYDKASGGATFTHHYRALTASVN